MIRSCAVAHDKGSSVRWQSIAIDQLGYATGLILTFSAATLGFALATIKDSSYQPPCWAKVSMLATLLTQLISLALGVICVINRLRDFRKTRRIARDRENLTSQGIPLWEINRRLEAQRAEVKKIGERTWLLFYWQIGTFAFGLLALAICFVIAYRPKLF